MACARAWRSRRERGRLNPWVATPGAALGHPISAWRDKQYLTQVLGGIQLAMGTLPFKCGWSGWEGMVDATGIEPVTPSV